MVVLELFEIVGKDFSREYDVNGVRDFLGLREGPLIRVHGFNPDFEVKNNYFENGIVPYDVWSGTEIYDSISKSLYSNLSLIFEDKYKSFDKLHSAYLEFYEFIFNTFKVRDEKSIKELDLELLSAVESKDLTSQIGLFYLNAQLSLFKSSLELKLYPRISDVYSCVDKSDYSSFDGPSFNEYVFREYGIL